MLKPLFPRIPRPPRTSQRGVVLLITLIMLVAMTLAAIAMMRSVDTTNVIAGNLAFQQTSIHSADNGTEEAIAYLYTVPNLDCSSVSGVGMPCVQGYKSFNEPALEPPTAGQSWDSYWTAMTANPGVRPLTNLPTGYSGAFVIEAMCNNSGRLNCAFAGFTNRTTPREGQDEGSSGISGGGGTATTPLYYYRITSRVEGPRNSVGYVQSIVSL